MAGAGAACASRVAQPLAGAVMVRVLAAPRSSRAVRAVLLAAGLWLAAGSLSAGGSRWSAVQWRMAHCVESL